MSKSPFTTNTTANNNNNNNKKRLPKLEQIDVSSPTLLTDDASPTATADISPLSAAVAAANRTGQKSKLSPERREEITQLASRLGGAIMLPFIILNIISVIFCSGNSFDNNVYNSQTTTTTTKDTSSASSSNVDEANQYRNFLGFCFNFQELLFYLSHGALTIGICAVIGKKLSGEYMMAAMWMLGLIHEFYGIGAYERTPYTTTSSSGSDGVAPILLASDNTTLVRDASQKSFRSYYNKFAQHSWLTWVIVELLVGAIAGFFARCRDTLDGCYTRSYNYNSTQLTACYLAGVWSGHVVVAGYYGLITVYSSIFVMLSIVGYALLVLKFLRAYNVIGAHSQDFLTSLSKVINMSFGHVLFLGGVIGFIAFYFLFPALVTLATRLPHTVLGSVAIVAEVIAYDRTRK